MNVHGDVYPSAGQGAFPSQSKVGRAKEVKGSGQVDVGSVVRSVKEGKPIKPKKGLTTSNTPKSSTTSIKKQVSFVRKIITSSGKTKLRANKNYPKAVNEIIKLSKPGKGASLSQRSAAAQFRKQLAHQLNELEKNGEIKDCLVEDVLQNIEENLVENKGADARDVRSFLTTLGRVMNKEAITQDLKSKLVHFCEQLPVRNQARMEKLGPSMAARDTVRTPMDVLTNFLAELSLASEKGRDSQVTDCLKKAKQALLSHVVFLEEVKKLLGDSKNKLEGHPQLQQLCVRRQSSWRVTTIKLAGFRSRSC